MKTKLYDERTAKELATQSANRLQEEAISKFKEIKKSMRSNACVQALLLALKDSLKKSTPMFVIFDDSGRYENAYYKLDEQPYGFPKFKYNVKAVSAGISLIYWSEGKIWHEDFLFNDFGLPNKFCCYDDNSYNSKEERFALIAFITILYEEVFNTFSVELLDGSFSFGPRRQEVSNLDRVIFDQLFNYKVLRVDNSYRRVYGDGILTEKYFFRRFLSDGGVWGVVNPFWELDDTSSSGVRSHKLDIVGVHFSDEKIYSEMKEYENSLKRSWY